ncbi:MAG: hypothetical protein P1V35_16245 [Planctomycetota bacterium]|nr:hypothetical protein [Planctomycetota bacterium]
MTTTSIFTLVVRLSGYFTMLFAGYTLLGLMFGPADFWSRGLLMALVYGGFGFAIMLLAPMITEISGADESNA